MNAQRIQHLFGSGFWARNVAIALLVALTCESPAVSQVTPFRPLDYIVIVHQSLDGSSLQQLLSLRCGTESWRFRKLVVNDGVAADSIKNFIQRLYDSSEFSPLNILLVGSAKRGCQGAENIVDASCGNLIPSYHMQDAWGGWTSYDQWFAYLERTDHVRRVARASVGRIPASTEAELQAYVNKVVQYEAGGGDATWKRTVLFLGGDLDRGPDYPSPPTVTTGIAELDALLPAAASSVVVNYSDNPNDAQAREQAFINNLNSGVGLVASLGTGSNWNNLSYIVQTPDFNAGSELSANGKYPLFIAASCNLGQVDPDNYWGFRSVAENLLLAPGRGAIAVIAPSGGTSDLSNTPYVAECFNRVFSGQIRRVGSLGMGSAAKLKASFNGPTDTYDMISIIGDPGLRIDLGSITSGQLQLEGSMELTDELPIQSTPFGSQLGLESVRAGVIKDGSIRGQRSYQIDGLDHAWNDPTSAWIVHDDLGLTLGPQSRFLCFWVQPIQHHENVGRFSVDCVFSDGTVLSTCATCGPRVDQYGTTMTAYYRSSPMGKASFYGIDLLQSYGRTVDKVVVTYDCSNPAMVGNFKAIFDDIALRPDWGFAPDVSPVEMQTNVVRSGTASVSISATDADMASFGDDLTVSWVVSNGYITGSGFDVTYHAPSTTVTGAVLTATVSDEGGHSEVRTKVFNVVNPPPPPSCPHVHVWDGERYIDQGAVLTRSRFETDSAVVRDFHPIPIDPTSTKGTLKISLREDGNDITNLERIALFALTLRDTDYAVTGIGRNGNVMRKSSPVAPVQCIDDQGFDQLSKVNSHDGVRFQAFGPGHLILRYEGLSRPGTAKALAEDGGGLSAEGPPKEQYKIAVPEQISDGEPTVPNYVSIAVLSPNGGWRELQRVAPRSVAVLADLIDLSPEIESSGGLWVKVEWTWSFSADDLSFFRFSSVGLTMRQVPLVSARHATRGSVRAALLADDSIRTSLAPGERIDLEFDANAVGDFDFAVMGLRGKYVPYTGLSEERDSESVPTEVVVAGQNTPNPFNSGTTISFSLPSESHVRVTIHNILGQEVAELENSTLPAGDHRFVWDGRDRNNRGVASGVYLYRIATERGSVSRKMVLLK